MWRRDFSRRIGPLRMLVAVCGALMLSAAAEAQMVVNITEPAFDATASGTLRVRASVSSVIEVSTVTAQVEGQQVSLKYSQQLNAWTNSIPLAGIPFGPHTLVVNARDLFGGAAQAMRTFTVDDPPTLTVREPINGTVSFGRVFLDIETVDDNPAGAAISVMMPGIRSYLIIASGTNRIRRWVNLPSQTIASPYVVVSAADSRGQTKSIVRSIAIESSNLVETAVAPGSILDFDAGRFLFTSQADIELSQTPLLPLGIFSPVLFGRPEPKMLNRATGQISTSRPYLQSLIEGPLDTIRSEFLDAGILAPYGANLLQRMINVISSTPQRLLVWNDDGVDFSWANQFIPSVGTNDVAIVGTTFLTTRSYSVEQGTQMALQDTEQTNQSYSISFPYQTPFAIGLGRNLELVYAVSNRVYRNLPTNPSDPYRDRAVMLLSTNAAGSPGRVATDGSNVAYSVQLTNSSEVEIRLITTTDESTLSTWPGFAGVDFRLNRGWTAYTKPGSSGQSQVWTRSPSGTQQQRTFFNASSTLESIGPNGEVTFLNNNARFISLPGVLQPVWVNSGQGRVRWEDGKLLVILGRSVLEFRMGQLQCAALADGSSRLTFTGPNGFSYEIQGSSDLQHWTKLWTFTHTTGTISWTNAPGSAPMFYRAVTAHEP